MGVYIPNEDMPEDCYTCFCYETEFNMCSLTGKRLDNIRIRRDDCPLIEIIRCGECKYYEESEYIRGDMVCKYHMGHTYYTEADRFCSHGERK